MVDFIKSEIGVMKLRWKHFLVLVAASLVPLLAVTWITQNASRRLGKAISGKAQNTLKDTISQEMVRATHSYANLIDSGGFATEQSLKMLVARAELALALPPSTSYKALLCCRLRRSSGNSQRYGTIDELPNPL